MLLATVLSVLEEIYKREGNLPVRIDGQSISEIIFDQKDFKVDITSDVWRTCRFCKDEFGRDVIESHEQSCTPSESDTDESRAEDVRE